MNASTPRHQTRVRGPRGFIGRNRGGSRAILGTYGDGSAFLVVRTFSGNVVIVKR